MTAGHLNEGKIIVSLYYQSAHHQSHGNVILLNLCRNDTVGPKDG